MQAWFLTGEPIHGCGSCGPDLAPHWLFWVGAGLHFPHVEWFPIKKHPELVNRKCRVLHQDNARPHVSLMTRQNCYTLAGKVWFILCIHQISHLWISIYFGLYNILLMEQISIPWKTTKGTLNSSLLKKIKSFGKMESWSCLKGGRR